MEQAIYDCPAYSVSTALTAAGYKSCQLRPVWARRRSELEACETEEAAEAIFARELGPLNILKVGPPPPRDHRCNCPDEEPVFGFCDDEGNELDPAEAWAPDEASMPTPFVPRRDDRGRSPSPWAIMREAGIEIAYFTAPQLYILRLLYQVIDCRRGWGSRDRDRETRLFVSLSPHLMAIDTGFSACYCRRAIGELAADGWIEIVPHPGRPREARSGWVRVTREATIAALRECWAKLRARHPRRPIPTGRQAGESRAMKRWRESSEQVAGEWRVSSGSVAGRGRYSKSPKSLRIAKMTSRKLPVVHNRLELLSYENPEEESLTSSVLLDGLRAIGRKYRAKQATGRGAVSVTGEIENATVCAG